MDEDEETCFEIGSWEVISVARCHVLLFKIPIEADNIEDMACSLTLTPSLGRKTQRFINNLIPLMNMAIGTGVRNCVALSFQVWSNAILVCVCKSLLCCVMLKSCLNRVCHSQAIQRVALSYNLDH